MITYTAEQHTAIDSHQRNVIVTAGAGSGKTRVLVARVMAVLEAHPEWRLPSVVAITFTDKAATELRDRIRSAIEARIQAAVDARDDAALSHWLDHQAALGRARISTIHALCARLLRANTAEAGLDPAFDVLDDTEAALLREDAVDLALARLAASERPGTDVLAAYDTRAVREVLLAHVSCSTARAVKTAAQEDVMDHWQAACRRHTEGVILALRADEGLWATLAWIGPDELARADEDKLAAAWRDAYESIPALYDGTADECVEAIEYLAGRIKLNVGTVGFWGSAERVREAKHALGCVRAALQGGQKQLLPAPGGEDVRAAAWIGAWADAVEAAAETYEALKRERAALDFDDLETLTCALLDDHPEVAARYAHPVWGEFRHVLVDEFQDTNDAQRAIIYRLCGVGQPGCAGRLFAVGDPKQSIYGFRGADVGVFGAVRADLTRDDPGADLALATSFRAHACLVGAFNAVFERVLGAPDEGRAPFDVGLDAPLAPHRPAQPWHGAPVTVVALRRPPAGDLDDKSGRYDARRWQAAEIARHIHQLVHDAVLVWDCEGDGGQGAYRPARYEDVAVLFRARTHMLLYEDVFKAAGLPYVTVAGFGYYNRQEVWDLLNLLRALYNPADDLALASVLRSPLFSLSDEALLALRLAPDAAPRRLWDALFDVTQVPVGPAEVEARAFACEVLAALRAMTGRTTIAELLWHAVEGTGFLATLTGLHDGARRRGNVEKLLALARARGRVLLGTFLAYAHDLTTREVREGEAAVEAEGAVKLMTVHASKGLEFPVVVIAEAAAEHKSRLSGKFAVDPDAGAVCVPPLEEAGLKPGAPFGWAYAKAMRAHRERAEHRRLLYVAATRAQDYLILVGDLSRQSEECWLRQWLRALEIDVDALAPSDDTYEKSFEWGACRVLVPQTVTRFDDRRTVLGLSGWDQPMVASGLPVPGVATWHPPLVAAVAVDGGASSGMLSATQLAALGSLPYSDPPEAGRAALRHAVLHDAPAPVRRLQDGPTGNGTARQAVGTIVHRALQAWLLPDCMPAPALADSLRAFAWGAGLSAEDEVARAVERALALLERFAQSSLRADLERAEQIYRELPFVYHDGARGYSGVIDVVYARAERRGRLRWCVLDYKTALIGWEQAAHAARRHYLQLGLYASALEARTGQTPETSLYYIHPARRLMIEAGAWQAALARVDEDLQAALDHGARPS